PREDLRFPYTTVFRSEGAVAEAGGLDGGVQLATDAAQQIEIESGGDAGAVVVGGLQALAVLEQVDTDQQAAAIRQQAAQVAQEVQCLMRLEVADAGAREESQRTGSPEGLGQAQRAAEIGAGGVHFQPGIVGGQASGAVDEEFPADVDAQVAAGLQGFQQ